MSPLFGGGLREFIFTQINNNNFDFIKEEIEQRLETNFPNIELESVEVLKDVNENTIIVKILYGVPNTGINDTLELNFR